MHAFFDNSTRQIIKACRVIRICCGSTATLHDQTNKLLRDIKTSDRGLFGNNDIIETI